MYPFQPETHIPEIVVGSEVGFYLEVLIPVIHFFCFCSEVSYAWYSDAFGYIMFLYLIIFLLNWVRVGGDSNHTKHMIYEWLSSPLSLVRHIYISSVPDLDNKYNQFTFLYLIDYPVITNSQTS